MTYKTLTNRQAGILAAMGRGIIPPGGPYFSIGAGDLENKWLPRVDYALLRMPALTRMMMKIMLGKGITFQDLADKIEPPTTLVSVAGTVAYNSPSRQTVYRFAKALGVAEAALTKA